MSSRLKFDTEIIQIWFLVACYATSHPAMSVGRSVKWDTTTKSRLVTAPKSERTPGQKVLFYQPIWKFSQQIGMMGRGVNLLLSFPKYVNLLTRNHFLTVVLTDCRKKSILEQKILNWNQECTVTPHCNGSTNNEVYLLFFFFRRGATEFCLKQITFLSSLTSVTEGFDLEDSENATQFPNKEVE